MTAVQTKSALPAFEVVPDSRGSGTREVVRKWMMDPRTGATVVPSSSASSEAGRGMEDDSGLTQSGWDPLIPLPYVEDPSVEDGTGGNIVYPPGSIPGSPLNPAFQSVDSTKAAVVPVGYVPVVAPAIEPLVVPVPQTGTPVAARAAAWEAGKAQRMAPVRQYIPTVPTPPSIPPSVDAPPPPGEGIGPVMTGGQLIAPGTLVLVNGRFITVEQAAALQQPPEPVAIPVPSAVPEAAPLPTVKVNFHRPGFKLSALYHEVIALPEFHGLYLVVDTQCPAGNVPELEANSSEPLILSWDGQDEPVACGFCGWRFLVGGRYEVSCLLVLQPKESGDV